MAYHGFMALGGVEVLNNSRVTTYARHLGISGVGCDDCPDLAGALETPPYSTPMGDDAPWYDPNVPESVRFGGFLSLSVEGLDSSTATRTPTALLGEGSSIGPVRRAHREISVEAVAVAADDCAMSYGLSWLASMLRGSQCGTANCGGDELCLFSCCPSCAGTFIGPLDTSPRITDTSCLPDADAATRGIVAPFETKCGDSQLRTLFDVGVLSGPSVTSRRRLPGVGCFGGSGGVIATVNWILVAGRPYLYHPVLPVDPQRLPLCGPLPAPPVPIPTPCPPGVDCTSDPNCLGPVLPPLPPVPVDPCFTPTPPNAARSVIHIPVSTLSPAYLEKVPIITIRTGASPVRSTTIRFYINPARTECNPDDLDPCTACATVVIPFIPAQSVFLLDGRVERALIDCTDSAGNSNFGAQDVPALFGDNGRLFTWPIFECNVDICVEILADPAYCGEATITVQMAARADAE